MLTRLIVAAGCLGMTSVAGASAVVELVPDTPGPYFGGESLTVDVWVHNDEPNDLLLSLLQFDFSNSDPALSLAPEFLFDFSSIEDDSAYQANLFPELPVPWTLNMLDCICPHLFLHLPAEGSLHVGSLGVELPMAPGLYPLDALNPDEPDEGFGARLVVFWPLPPSIPQDIWRAFDGEITGGGYDLVVVPEPGSLSLLLLGAFAIVFRRHRRTLGPVLPVILAGAVVVGAATTGWAQPMTLPSVRVAVDIDSGNVPSPTGDAGYEVVYSQAVSSAGATWVRLHFAEVALAGSQEQGNGSFLRITSARDGAVQTLDSFALNRWRNTSAYFNGNEVLVELLACANDGVNRVVIDEICAGAVGDGSPEGGSGGDSSECVEDDRVLSDDPRTGRFVFEVGDGQSICTAFLFNGRPNCLLSAGHCCEDVDWEEGEYPAIVEFNVPLSNPDGSINHPPPEDQYVGDEASFQFVYIDQDDDWCYFGAFDNTETGLSPLEAQGASYRMADQALPADDRRVRMVGYGDDSTPWEHRAVQQTDTGAFSSLDGALMGYTIHTARGTSGAPVEYLCRGLVYGIHTSASCVYPIYLNFGTAIHHPDLQAALAVPQGVCAEPQDCNVNGIDDVCDIDCGPAGGACDVAGCGGSADCTYNGVPDECEPDCNRNGVADSCDIDQGVSLDELDNGVPDECEVTWFVDADAPSGGDGLSWATAFNDLQDALTQLEEPCGRSVARVWVAAGTYTPDRGTGVQATGSLSFHPWRTTWPSTAVLRVTRTVSTIVIRPPT